MAVTGGRRLVNLPAETTSFVNRTHDIAAVVRLLSSARLITLVGVAGVGKTRLAVQVAAQLRPRFPGGVWLVELAPVADPALICCTVSHAIGLRDDTGGDPFEPVAHFLRERRALLILDNCEHLVDGCATLSTRLLGTARRLRIIATSRHMLQASGEHVWDVRPLALPEDGAQPQPGGSGGVEAAGGSGSLPHAVELFRERAAQVTPTFAVTEANAHHVGSVCRRLDGIPLAIELAAARLPGMSVDQLLAGLDDQFRLLRREAPGTVPHHRTLGATLDWSYGLCDPPEQAMWARLSVFAGSFDLSAAEQVCAGDGITRDDVVDVLDGLVGKSIVLPERHGDLTRFRMLQTLRQYGSQKLRTADEKDRWQNRHAELYLRLAEQAEREWFGPGQASWFARLGSDHENLRAALHNLTVGQAGRQAQRLAADLWFYWVFSGRVTEGRFWLDRALEEPSEPGPVRARALWANAFLAGIEGDLQLADRLAEQARMLASEVDDCATEAHALARLGVLAVYRGEPGPAAPLLTGALDRYADLDAAGSPTAVLARLGLSMSLLGQQDLTGAAEVCRDAIAICRRHQDRMLIAFGLNLLARIDWLIGALDGAADHIREAVAQQGADTSPVAMATAAEQLAWITGAAGDHERAAVLLGVAGQLWDTFGARGLGRAPYFRAAHDECVAAIHGALDEGAFEVATRRGRQVTVEQAVGLLTSPLTARPA